MNNLVAKRFNPFPGLQPRESRQQEFVAFLQTDSGAQQGADVLQVPLEQLKTVIQERLTAKQKPQPAATTQQRVGPARIYLICDQVDLENTSALEAHLFDEGFEVLLPAFDDDEAAVREAH